ncbi:tail fiber domain-containing protein [Buttiauxella noackiae]|uniref:tail fiber domain-containing protein n=1 Tax=Buttiauxella noackiae TaxID=82992 RepID=UPI000553DCAC|nr:tail fiber domain-containing protein [Buttiauxella noackiae]
MAKLQVRRTKTAGVKPTPAQILEGELIVNLADKKLYTKNDSGAVIQIANPEQADKLEISTALTVGGVSTLNNGAVVAKAVDVTGTDAVINIGSGTVATPGVNFKVSPTKTHTIKATDQNLEITADRVDIKSGKLSLNPLGAGEIQGKASNKILSDDGQGNVTLSGSRDGTTPGFLILGGKTQGHNTQAVKLSSDLVNSAGDVLINSTTGKIRTAMLDTVFSTPNDVAGNYYNKGETDAKYQTIANTTANFYNRTQIATVLNDYYTKTGANGLFQTIAGMADYYTATAADAKFQTIAADATRNYSKTETDTKLALLATKTELTTLTNNVYSKSALDTILLDGYLSKTQIAATYQTIAADAARNYSKTESDARYYDKTTADGRYFGKQAGNIEMDSYLLTKAVDGTQTTNNTSMAYSGFYRMNQDQNQLGGMNIHVAHPLYGAAHARGISFTYGSNSYALNTYRYDANGQFIGSMKIYTAADKPTAGELGVLPSSGAASLNGTLTTTGNITSSTGEFISGNGNGFRITQGGYGSFMRNDGVSTYFMSTALNDPNGGWSGIRPLRWNNSTGLVNVGNGLEVNGSFYVNGGTITTGDISTSGSLTIGGANNVSAMVFSPAGGSASRFRIYNWGSGTRAQVLELTDNSGWLFYAQRLTAGNVEFSVNGALQSTSLQSNSASISGHASVSTLSTTGQITAGVNNVGGGSYASQHTVGAGLFQNITSTGTSEYWPIVKQRYTPGNSTWSMGTLINSNNFIVHFINSAGTQRNFGFNSSGVFSSSAGILVNGALTGATTGAFSGAVTAGNITSSGNTIMMQSNQRRHIAMHNGTQYDGYIYKDSNGAWQFNNGANGGTWSMNTNGAFNSSGAISSGGGVAVGGALTGATTGAFSGAVSAASLNCLSYTNTGQHTFAGLVYGNGNGNFADVYIRSDKRLKTNFVEVKNATDKVQKLTAYHYDKKANLQSEIYDSKEVGIIAQDLKEVLPEAVVKDSNGLLTISNSAVNALLVQAVKELTERVKELEAK